MVFCVTMAICVTMTMSRLAVLLVSLGSAGPVYIQVINVVITVPADGLAPGGARPSAGTVMTSKIYSCCPLTIWNMFVLIRLCYSEWPTRYRGIHRVNLSWRKCVWTQVISRASQCRYATQGLLTCIHDMHSYDIIILVGFEYDMTTCGFYYRRSGKIFSSWSNDIMWNLILSIICDCASWYGSKCM